jgi:hypothetical protein
VAVILSSTNLEERIRGGMSMSLTAFVTQTLSQICSPGDPSYGSDCNNLCAALDAQPIKARTFVKLLAGSPANSCLMLLVGVVEHWILKLSDAFPRTAAGIEHAQIDFDRARESKLKSFIADFMEEYDASGLPHAEVSRIGFKHLGWFLHHVMFMVWSHSVCDHDKPPVKVPNDCLVGKHAHPVIYYVVGWTLYSASKALTVNRDKRLLFFGFSESQSIDKDVAKSMDLPTSLVDRRKRKSSVYCLHAYFEFICFVESVFLANLLLKMMLAYIGGDIMSQIKISILGNERAMERFTEMSGINFDTCQCQQLMAYILERYANMRGTFFVRHLKGNSGDQIKKLAESQATRTKVVNAVVCSQKIVVDIGGHPDDDNPEIAVLWRSALSSVQDRIAHEEDDNSNRSNE